MFKIVVVVLLAYILLKMCDQRSTHTAVDRATLNNHLLENQDRILFGLAEVENFYVQRFITDWRQAYPAPSSENLSELRQIEHNIKENPDAAMKYTLDFHQHNDTKCMVSSPLSSPFSDTDCKPGL